MIQRAGHRLDQPGLAGGARQQRGAEGEARRGVLIFAAEIGIEDRAGLGLMAAEEPMQPLIASR
ncbi:hypothetical protein [Falsiroseomonas sp. HW251]|uniref:hypothetical protein n=1 Tax=Falsiroseomonas sp. HW251 TaxID=3390998 RepID=UPI003D31EC51